MLKRFGFKKDELITVYKGYIRPLLEYADVVWNSSLTLKQTKTIEQVQRRACRIVLDHNFLSYNKALRDCKIESLVTRREDHCLKFAEGLADTERTKNLLPPTRLESHSRNLRNAHKISQLRLGLRVLKVALFLTSLSCWISNVGSSTLTSLHAYLSVYMFSNFMWFYLFFLCRGGGGEGVWNLNGM